MLDPGDSRRSRYSAFISYSRRDERAAAWLQSALETYRVPGKLVGKPSPFGPVPRRLAPVFRDRLELAAAPDLQAALTEALGASDALIVVCSPASAQSAWVNREIEMFRALGRGDRILAALFDGDESDAFPPALTHGDLGETITPLAADFRKEGDGRRLGKLKLVAVLTGVGLEPLLHREQDRRIRRLTGLAGASAGLAAAFAFVAIAALNAEARAEREQAKAERLVEALLTDLRKAVQPVGSLALKERLNEAALTYFRGQSLADMPDVVLAQRARLLLAMGEDDLARGRPTTAAVQFEEAHRTTEVRLATNPKDPQRLFDHAQSEFWRGYTAWETGNVRQAATSFASYARLAARLLQDDPANADWQMEAGYADSNIGMLALRQTGDARAAEARFTSALLHFRAAEAQRPSDRDIAHQIVDGLGWLADSQRMGLDLDAAFQNRLRQRAMLMDLRAGVARDAGVETGLVRNALALARIEADQGHLAAAANRLDGAAAAARDVAAADRQDKLAAQQARMIALFAAQVQLRRPAAERLPLAQIDASIGACNRQGPLDEPELEDFCQLVKARLLLQQGQWRAAKPLVSAVASRRVSKGDMRLSQGFGINFQTELAFFDTNDATVEIMKG